MKRIWMVQQKNLHCNYLPLRWGIGQYSDEQISELPQPKGIEASFDHLQRDLLAQHIPEQERNVVGSALRKSLSQGQPVNPENNVDTDIDFAMKGGTIHKFSEMFKPDAPDHPDKYCPKTFTTRTHPLSGEYYVVEGSRFKAKPVMPEIRFEVSKVANLNLHGVLTVLPGNEFDFSWKTFAENDLGVKGATFEQLRDELLRLNKKATLDTPFFVNLLEPL